MVELDFLQQFVNKQVDFRFHERHLKFSLSQSLFSSNDVDEGTRLLLKTIAKRMDGEQLSSVLDIGCGVGVLGICLKKLNPTLAVTFQDRDALALAFTEMNSQLNEIGKVEIQEGLGLQNINDRQFDLIISNLPGKAGQPVLTEMVRRMPRYLTEMGQAAVVIVKPLADMIERTIVENGSEITHIEARRGYTVFHFRKGMVGEGIENGFSAYMRGAFPFSSGKFRYELQTVHNIPEFDTLGFQTRLAITTLKNRKNGGRVLFWNPGQGHLPIILNESSREKITELVIAGRDLLSLEISKRNLMAQGISPGSIQNDHLPHFLSVSGRYDFLVIFPDMDPGVPWDKVLLQKCVELLCSQGRALLTAKSTFMHRIVSNNPGLIVEAQKKRHGLRSVLFQKPT